MFFKDFRSAISSYGQSFKLINELKLWKFFLVPIIIGLLFGGLVIWGAYSLSDNIGDYLANFWPFSWGEDFMASVGRVFGVIIVLLLGLLIYKHAVMALASPFMTPVSEKIEMHLTGKQIDPTDTAAEYIAALMRGIKINARNLLLELLITFPLIILGFIPLVNIVTAVMIFYVQAYYSGFGNMDYTLERHRSYKETIKFVRKNSGVAVGNGTIFILLLFIPVVGMCLALPLSTAAATVDTVKKLNSKDN